MHLNSKEGTESLDNFQVTNPLQAMAQGYDTAARAEETKRSQSLKTAGIVAAAARGINNEADFEAAKIALARTGAIPEREIQNYTFDQLPTLLDQVRGLEGQISDERDRRDYETGVSQWGQVFNQRQSNSDRVFDANRQDNAQSQQNWLDAFQLKIQGAQASANKPADEYGRYAQEQQAAGKQPLSRIDYAQAKKGNGFEVTTADGTTIRQGGARKQPKLTVDAAKNSGFLLRTQESNEILNRVDEQGLRFGQEQLNKAPLGLGTFGQDTEFQQFDQARRDFINAILRRESGAVISDQEFDNAEKQYFPVPGNPPELVDQKRRNRETAIEGLRIGSGAGASLVDEQRQQQGGIQDLTDDQLQQLLQGN